MSKNDGQTTESLLDVLYRQNYYTLIDIYLSRQKNKNISQQINFRGKLEEDDDATMLLITEKQRKTILNLFQIH